MYSEVRESFHQARLTLVWNVVRINRLEKRCLCRKPFPKCLWRFSEVTQTNQFLKGVKGEPGTLGKKHSCKLVSLSADRHVRLSAVIADPASCGCVSSGFWASRPLPVLKHPTVATMSKSVRLVGKGSQKKKKMQKDAESLYRWIEYTRRLIDSGEKMIIYTEG